MLRMRRAQLAGQMAGKSLGRDVYLDCPPGEFDKWVTELQIEVSSPS